MSEWITFNQDNVDIDLESGDVNILVGSNYNGAIYLDIPIADFLQIARAIERPKPAHPYHVCLTCKYHNSQVGDQPDYCDGCRDHCKWATKTHPHS